LFVFLIAYRISRYARRDPSSECLFVTSLFFSQVDNEKLGLDTVERWFKGLNIFQKKYIFVPINDSLHWTLIVIINPGLLGSRHSNSDEISCILFLNSLKTNKKVLSRYCKLIRAWLNKEWLRINKKGVSGNLPTEDIFTEENMPVYVPKGRLIDDIFYYQYYFSY